MYSKGNPQNTCFRLGPPAGSPRDQFKKNVTDPEQEIDKKIGHKISRISTLLDNFPQVDFIIK